MDREEYMALAMSYYEKLEALKSKDNFYDYEKSFDQVWQDLGRRYLEKQLNEGLVTTDRRKKKLSPNLER